MYLNQYRDKYSFLICEFGDAGCKGFALFFSIASPESPLQYIQTFCNLASSFDGCVPIFIHIISFQRYIPKSISLVIVFGVVSLILRKSSYIYLSKNFRDINDLEWVSIICKMPEWGEIIQWALDCNWFRWQVIFSSESWKCPAILTFTCKSPW